MKYILLFTFISISCFVTCFGQDVSIHILDVGAGHSSIIELSSGNFIVFDAGSSYANKGKITRKRFRQHMPENATIELFVVSHTDADHLYAADYLLKKYQVNRTVRTGYPKSAADASLSYEDNTGAYRRMERALKYERENRGMQEINLNKQNRKLNPSDQYTSGDVKVTFLAGFGRPESSWGLKERKHKLNAVSIIMRLDYRGQSILFTGDALGRFKREKEGVLRASEKYLIDNVSAALLNVDIVVASHHGADNGSSRRFIELTKPKYVIFPAGDKYGHPVKQTAERYLTYANVDPDKIFRTDRDEGWVKSNELSSYRNAAHDELWEWNGQAIKECKDKPGDDDILVTFRHNGKPNVKYLYSNLLI